MPRGWTLLSCEPPKNDCRTFSDVPDKRSWCRLVGKTLREARYGRHKTLVRGSYALPKDMEYTSFSNDLLMSRRRFVFRAARRAGHVGVRIVGNVLRRLNVYCRGQMLSL